MKSRERNVTFRCFRYLVTPSGTKIALNVRDLADLTGLRKKREQARINDVLKQLCSVRLLRSVGGRYEIYHDTLAPAILEWRRRYAIARRARIVGWGVLLVLALLISISGYSVYRTRKAQELALRREQEAQVAIKKRKELEAKLEARQAQWRKETEQINAVDTLIDAKDYKSALQKLQQMDAEAQPGYQLLSNVWNTLCWKGATDGKAKLVQPACERAVALDPDLISFVDSRGLDRALIGDYHGAIEDFNRVLDSPDMSESRKEERAAWVRALKKGEDPFTREVLAKISSE
jgi:hypothetical protein